MTVASAVPVTQPKVEPRHDFAAKLQQPETRPAVMRYIAWRQAADRARANGESIPPLPKGLVASVNLDLTTACNYACDHCIDLEALNGKVKHDYAKLLDSLQYEIDQEDGLRSVILIGGGEPTTHPKFGDTVRFLKERGIQTAVVSNGARNHKIGEVADLFDSRDWIRLSLDSGTDDTFQKMHKPKVPITLEAICQSVPSIRERNPKVPFGFSFIITWEGLKGQNGVPLIPNIHEVIRATKLARDSGFTYMSLKPALTRRPNGAEVMDPMVIEDFDRTIARISEAVEEAETHETAEFKVVKSTNLRVLLNGTWREFTNQPHTCHMQAFRQVLSPLGVFNCPAHRGVAKARIADADGYSTPLKARQTEEATLRILDNFDPSVECAEVTCLYQPTNWWLENIIAGKDGFSLAAFDGDDYFL